FLISDIRKLFYSNCDSRFIRRKALLIVADNKFDCTFNDSLTFLQFYFLLKNNLLAKLQNLHVKSVFKLLIRCWLKYLFNKLIISFRCKAERSWNGTALTDMLRINIPAIIDRSLEEKYCFVFSGLLRGECPLNRIENLRLYCT